MAENITIQFRATGGAALEKTINAVYAANERLAEGQKAYVQAVKNVTQSTKAAIIAHKKEEDAIVQKQLHLVKIGKLYHHARIEDEKRTKALKKAVDAQVIQNVQIKNNIVKLRQLTTRLKENNLTLKKVGVSFKMVRLAAKGHANALAVVTAAVNLNTKANINNDMSTRLLTGSFAVARSKLLIFSFAMTLAIRPIAKFVKASSDQQEILNKSTVVFGNNIGIVRKWAKAMGDSVGRAESTLLAMVSSLQDLFVPMGYTREAAAQMSTSLTSLAIDVASFSNKLDADVLQDFQSALVGNHKTVRKYGVVITESTLQQEAMTLGLITTARQLSENEKVQARMSLIQKGSADAMGDAARTSKDYAQSLVRFSEVMKETSEQVGALLQPILALGLRFASDPRNIRAFGIALTGVAVAYAAVKIQARLAAGGTKLFTKALTRTGIGALVVALGYAADALMTWWQGADKAGEKLDDLEAKLIANSNATEKFIGNNEKLAESIMKNTSALKKKIATVELESSLIGEISSQKRMETYIDKQAIQMTKDREGGVGALTDAERILIEVLYGKEVANKRLLDAESMLNTKFKQTYGETKERIQLNIDSKKSLLSEAETALSTNQKKLDSMKNIVAGTKAYSDIEEKRIQKDRDAITLTEDSVKLTEKFLAIGTLREEQQEAINMNNSKEIVAIGKKLKAAQADYDLEEDLYNIIYERHNANQTLVNDYDEAVEKIDGVNQKNEELTKSVKDQTEVYNKNAAGLKDMVDNLDKYALALEGTQAFSESFSSVNSTMSANFGDATSSMLSKWGEFTQEQRESGEANNELAIAGAAQVAGMVVDAQMQQHEATMSRLRAENAAELDQIKSSRKYQKMSAKDKKKIEEEQAAKLAENLKKEFDTKKDLQRAGVVMDTAAAMVKSFALSPATFGLPMIAVAGALGAAQLALINQQKPPKAQYGGLVGGNLHSAGGTLIEAERGEFIMNRGAVDSVGVENMNRINSGGMGGSPINVSFSGNINSDDFIESEAIPKIKEAIRRGADIGVS